MKVLMINVVCGVKSTGRICTDIATALERDGHEVVIAYGRESVPRQYAHFAYRIGTENGVKIHTVKSRILDNCGFNSKRATAEFIRWIRVFNPDIIHIHNLHGYYINVEILFKYLRVSGKRIIWTLHDCWSFTGHCSYFDYAKCEKWKTECSHCAQKKEYPESVVFDNSKKNYTKKKELFRNIPNMELVTPSEWLCNLVKNSFLKDYKVSIIYNGINTNKFQRHKRFTKNWPNINEKKVILGVAAVWNRRKGLEDFIKLSDKLDDNYVIILVGLSQNQVKYLPSRIIGISRVDGVKELAELYSISDVFVNPTYEDNYPTTNLEAISCGTPVITYDTGGSVESAQKYGVIVEQGNVDKLKEEIMRVCSLNWIPIDRQQFDVSIMVSQYLKLYTMGEEFK